MRVDDIMKPPQACRMGDSARECAKLMEEKNIGFVPICNEAGEPVGTVTDRDLAIRVLAEGRPPDTRVDDVITRGAVCVRTGDDLEKAEELMRDQKKSRIMVCDAQGKLVGVISLSDVVSVESEGPAARTLREVAQREVQQPHAS
jgi:CBS domain-containing protein